jgi:addiction module HigA family antidote
MAKNEYFPQSIPHPGVTLREKLVEIGMGPKEFAIRTGKPEKTITAILNGESNITPEMAAQFENVLRIPMHFWLNYQTKYNELIAEQKKQQAVQESTEWAKQFPYAKMAEFGWVQATRRAEEKAKQLFSFFGVFNKSAWENFYYEKKLMGAFRISLKHTNEPFAVSAWLRQGEILAQQLIAPAYNEKKFRQNLILIKQLMAKHPDDFFTKLQQLCLEAGVKVVYTPCLPKAPIHGSTRWIGDTPIIQLSARYKQNDIFWFTFFHEAGHILKHGKKYISIENIKFGDTERDKELEADQFSVEWTFSKEQEQEVMAKDVLYVDDIVEFAEKFGTHPAMIIGRLQHNGEIPYSVGRQFIVPVNLSNSF